MRSEICWFAEICKSQCLSHFAASFIASRAEVSIVKGGLRVVCPIGPHLFPAWDIAIVRGASSVLTDLAALVIKCSTNESVQTPYHRTSLIRNSVNDPSAGSPTETLLRLILPLSDKVYETSRKNSLLNHHSPIHSPEHSIGRSDGRCVQRAGT